MLRHGAAPRGHTGGAQVSPGRGWTRVPVAAGRTRGDVGWVPAALTPLCPRVPKRPIINTPVVSISVHAAAGRAPRALEKPITLQFRLLETQERSKPICVFWNHSLL